MDKNIIVTEVSANNLEVGLFRYVLAPEEKFSTLNSALLKILGYASKINLLEKRLEDLFFNSSDKNVFLGILQRNNKVRFFEAPFKKKDGSPLWVAISASLFYKKNNTKCLEGLVQDISSQRKVYEVLSKEKDFLQALFDNIPDAIYFKDKSNRIVKANRFYLEGIGLSEDAIIGRTDFDFFPYEQAKQMFEDDQRVLETGIPMVGKIEKTLLSNGTWNQVITTKLPMYDRTGMIIGTMGTTRDMTSYANFEKQRMDTVINALEILGRALEMRDPYTFSHTRHVANIAAKIAKTLGWEEDRVLGIKLAGELHDLGKISIPLDILNKPGKLSDLEYCMIKEHSVNCYNLIKDINFPFPLAEIIYQHHERLNGTGYPRGLKNSDILIESKVLAVSDILEAMTHHRPYREALGIDMACKELKHGRGTKYDSGVVDVVFDLISSNGDKKFWLGE